jgi:two-component sensor histidine kinase
MGDKMRIAQVLHELISNAEVHAEESVRVCG